MGKFCLKAEDGWLQTVGCLQPPSFMPWNVFSSSLAFGEAAFLTTQPSQRRSAVPSSPHATAVDFLKKEERYFSVTTFFFLSFSFKSDSQVERALWRCYCCCFGCPIHFYYYISYRSEILEKCLCCHQTWEEIWTIQSCNQHSIDAEKNKGEICIKYFFTYIWSFWGFLNLFFKNVFAKL